MSWIPALALMLGVMAAAAPSARAALPVGFADVTVGSGWTQAVGLTFDTSGRMFVWEKGGKVWIVENGVKLPTPLIDISEEVGDWRDHGLLGFALDPDFLFNGRIYLMYVVDYHYLAYFGTPSYYPTSNFYFRDTIVRITRYTANQADNFHSVNPASRQILVGESMSTGFPILHQSHGAGTLAFGHDGSLLASCGDGASYQVADDGGPIDGSSNTALSDGIITPDQDVGAYRAQQVNSLSGKVIRISPDTGDGLPDNPFYDAGSPRAPRSRVWAMGLRNPFRLAIRPDAAPDLRHDNGPGPIFIGDNGWNVWEELNVASEPGMNFGWPLFEGFEQQDLYQSQGLGNPQEPNPLGGQLGCNVATPFRNLTVQDVLANPSFPNPCNPGIQLPATLHLFEHSRPAIDWRHDGGPSRVGIYNGNDAATINVGAPGSPVSGAQFGGNSSLGGAWYPQIGAYPPQYRGNYFHGDYVAGWIRSFVFNDLQEPVEIREFVPNGALPGMVCMAVNPADTFLYFIQFDAFGNSSVHKLVFDGNLPPVVAVSTVGNNYGASPLNVQFSSAGTIDPEGQPLVYSWNFGDGSPLSNQPSPSHVFTAPNANPARFDVTLTVTDPGGEHSSASLVVSPNNTPPVVTITSPPDGYKFPLGVDTLLPLTSDVTDAEHTPAQRTCQWQVLLHHNTHIHPEPVDNNCSSSALLSGGHGSFDEVFYFEVINTVTDAQGLSGSDSALIYPDLPACTGDINHDNATNTLDLIQLLGKFGQTVPPGSTGDLDFNGQVNTLDLVILLANFGCSA